MALGGINAGYDTSDPADSKNAGLGAGDIRSFKTNIQGALDNEHQFPASGGSMGGHRLGSARAFLGAASAISSSDTDGRLMLTSDTSRLYHVGSAVTQFLGGRFALEFSASGASIAGTATASKVSQVMKMEAGQFTMPNASTGTTMNLQHAYIAGTVVAQCTAVYNGSFVTLGGFPVPQISSGSQIIVFNYNAAGVPSTSSASYTVNYFIVGAVAG